jgi:ketosteroid isomerase-like protein
MLRGASEVERASSNAGRDQVSGEIRRAVSQERVERLHRDYETFNATKRIDDAAIAPDVVVIAPDNMLGGGVLSGRDALARNVREFTDTFDDFRVDVEEVFDRGDRILAFVRFSGSAHASGIPLDLPLAHLWTFRGDLATEQRVYLDREEALEAPELRE